MEFLGFWGASIYDSDDEVQRQCPISEKAENAPMNRCPWIATHSIRRIRLQKSNDRFVISSPYVQPAANEQGNRV